MANTTELPPSDEAKQALHKLADYIGLKRIICVDDHFSIYLDHDFSVFKGLYTEVGNQVDVPELPRLAELWDEDEDAIQLQWAMLDPTVCQEIIQRFHAVRPPVATLGPPSEYENDQSAFEAIRKLCESQIEYIFLNLAQWNDSKDKFLADSDSILTLFLFDKDMRQEGGRDNEGVYLMIDAQKSVNAYFGLFSQTFESNQERERWESLHSEHPDIEGFRCVPISKKSLLRKPIEFVRRVKFTALISPCHKLCDLVASEIELARAEALDKLKKLNPYDFDHVIFVSSKNEGSWEIDSMLRLFTLYQRDKVRELIQSSSEINGLLGEIRPLSALPSGSLNAKSEAWRLQHREIYEEASYINKHHLSIENGDIFEDVSTDKKYILVMQPCDLMVREQHNDQQVSGERKTGILDAVFVDISENKTMYCSEMPYFNQQKSAFADFVKAKNIRLDVVDLCVFREDGVASICVDDVAPSDIIPVWRTRFSLLLGRAKDILSMKEKFSLISEESIRSEAYRLLTPHACLAEPNLFTVSLEGDVLSYKLRRIQRLAPARAAVILAQFCAFQARPAFETDFGKT